MSFIVTFIAAVFVFSAVIAIHEFGHFMVAKLCGVQVNEFSIGMGPVLCKRVRKGTQYSIRALPVGGFVALEGEESPESKQVEERSNPSAADGGSSPDRGALGKEGRLYLPKKQMRTGRFYCFNAEINPWAASCPA